MSAPTILVIGDNLADIALLRYGLDRQDAEYKLEIFTDGAAALDYVADHRAGRREHTPCVILLDLHLPKYNGLEILAALRQDPVLTHIHVVVLTSHASPLERVEVEAAGAICRNKPFQLEEFVKLSCEILELCNASSPRDNVREAMA